MNLDDLMAMSQNSFSSLFSSLTTFEVLLAEYTSLTQDLQRVESELQDIMHEIEFMETDASADHSRLLVADMHRLRKERREIKNTLSLISPQVNFFKSLNTHAILEKGRALASTQKEHYENPLPKVYTNRVRTDLKAATLVPMSRAQLTAAINKLPGNKKSKTAKASKVGKQGKRKK